MNETSRIAVIGSGSWATALVKVLLNHEKSLTWFIKEDDIRDHIRNFNHNPKYLSSVVFDANCLIFTENITETIENNDILIFVVPSAFLTQWIEPYQGYFKGFFLISAIKGIISSGFLTVAEYFNQITCLAILSYFIAFNKVSVAQVIGSKKIGFGFYGKKGF